MQSRLRLAGQAVQPLLLMFPLGLFAMALIFDLATVLGAPHLLGTVAFGSLVAGLIGGVVAALAGGYEAISARTPATARVAFLSLLIDVGVLFVFAVLTLMRVRTADRATDPGLLVVEVAGLLLAGFGAWYGGRFGDPRAPMSVLDQRRPVPVIPRQPRHTPRHRRPQQRRTVPQG